MEEIRLASSVDKQVRLPDAEDGRCDLEVARARVQGLDGAQQLGGASGTLVGLTAEGCHQPLDDPQSRLFVLGIGQGVANSSGQVSREPLWNLGVIELFEYSV